MKNKHTFIKPVVAIITLLAVSACSQPSSREQVFRDYNYQYDYNSYDTAYIPNTGSTFSMNNNY